MALILTLGDWICELWVNFGLNLGWFFHSLCVLVAVFWFAVRVCGILGVVF